MAPVGPNSIPEGVFASTTDGHEAPSLSKLKAKGRAGSAPELGAKAKAKRPSPQTRTESRRHLTSKLNDPEERYSEASEAEGETIDMNDLSLPSPASGSASGSAQSRSQSPRWWFDRQVLSLGGVCEYGEDEAVNEENTEARPRSPVRTHTPIRSASSPAAHFIATDPSPSSSRALSSSLSPSNTNTLLNSPAPTTPERSGLLYSPAQANIASDIPSSSTDVGRDGMGPGTG